MTSGIGHRHRNGAGPPCPGCEYNQAHGGVRTLNGKPPGKSNMPHEPVAALNGRCPCQGCKS